MQGTATPTGTQTGASTLFEQGRRILEELTTVQGRAVMTAVLLVCALLVVFVIAPLAVRQLRQIVASRLFDGRVADGIELLGEYIPTTFSGITLRCVQFAVLVVSGLGLLVVWGLVDIAVTTGQLIVAAIPHLVNSIITVLLIVSAYIGADQLKRAIDRFSRGADSVTQHQEEVVLRVGQLVLFVGVGAAILTLWSFDLSGLLVGAGFLGIVVGLAARQTLGSLIAGFVLMFSRPFKVGDWIQVDDREGIVTNITIFNTRLQNFDGETVVLPNDKVSDESLTNRSDNGRLRLRTDVGIDYEADIDRAEAAVLSAIEAVDIVEESPAPKIIPKAFGDSSVVLELRYWIEHPSPPRKWRAVGGVVTNVKDALDEAEITIPFPQRELSAREGTATALRETMGDGQTEAGEDLSESQATD
ncbi:mechanosensitive ion channel protein [Halobacteriales archaeon QS_4_62_28]|nr:MAG: mechanosensitive ion channel protein [Halobacteriales archaeon QS_4_62_28]